MVWHGPGGTAAPRRACPGSLLAQPLLVVVLCVGESQDSASRTGQVDRVKPAASHVPSGTVDKAGLELCGPADCGMVVLQYDRAYQASEGE